MPTSTLSKFIRLINLFIISFIREYPLKTDSDLLFLPASIGGGKIVTKSTLCINMIRCKINSMSNYLGQKAKHYNFLYWWSKYDYLWAKFPLHDSEIFHMHLPQLLSEKRLKVTKTLIFQHQKRTLWNKFNYFELISKISSSI